ncbi:hypothetical protein F5Y03DRAFT_395545 [Xylaria venustula]|nr:hypothetical protein F5Y03DRAFT_395545 [Xylaria venustula]
MRTRPVLESVTPTLVHWQPILPKPVPSLPIHRPRYSSISNRKERSTPLEYFTRVDDCLIGVFGLDQDSPKKKRRGAPKACLKCQFDRKACFGGRSCSRCLGVIRNIQINKAIHWQYCVDSDLLDNNPIQDILSGLRYHVHRGGVSLGNASPVLRATSTNALSPIASMKLFSEWGPDLYHALQEPRIFSTHLYELVLEERSNDPILVHSISSKTGSKRGKFSPTALLEIQLKSSWLVTNRCLFNDTKSLLTKAKSRRSAQNNRRLVQNLTMIYCLSKNFRSPNHLKRLSEGSSALGSVGSALEEEAFVREFASTLKGYRTLHDGLASVISQETRAFEHLSSFSWQWIQKLISSYV